MKVNELYIVVRVNKPTAKIMRNRSQLGDEYTQPGNWECRELKLVSCSIDGILDFPHYVARAEVTSRRKLEDSEGRSVGSQMGR